jgi:hypothetical protein
MRQSLCLLCFAALAQPAAVAGLTAGLRASAKAELLSLVRSGDEPAILAAVKRTERINPGATPFPWQRGETLRSPLLSDNWLMIWTTSDSIAGRSRPPALRARTPPEQRLDVAALSAVNAERVLGVRNAVEATLTPASATKVCRRSLLCDEGIMRARRSFLS